ncbi:MAG: hypothetical protein AAGD38_06905 [Acidobacteriota bacterium]
MENRVLWVALIVVAVLAAALLLKPTVEEQLAPEITHAWIAIEVDGEGVARPGPVDLPVDTSFMLHGVLEAVTRDGRAVYYTEAPALEIDGIRVADEDLRPWDRPGDMRARWSTLEGTLPYVELKDESTLATSVIEPFLRASWPLAWSIPGDLEPANDDHLQNPRTFYGFGTQWLQIRFERYSDERDLLPEETWASPDATALWTDPSGFRARISAVLPGALGPASSVFGLTQLELPASASEEQRQQLRDLADAGLIFSRLTIIRDQLRAAGLGLDTVDWQLLSLTGDAVFGGDASPGDLLQVGERVTVLWRDEGTVGIVDGEDLVFDFYRGAAVRPLAEVFSGEAAKVARLSL